MTPERLALALVLLAALAVRCVGLDQPIVENYVGRQVPTAMVARNLARGGSPLLPRVDTAPFPSLFLVEPPIYAGLVAILHRVTGLGVGPAGRLVSALAIVLATWALHGLVRRRAGPVESLSAALLFATLPVTLRYGRAVQPDMLALALVFAGANLWDDWQDRGGRRGDLAWLLLALGLATKALWAFALVPVGCLIASRIGAETGSPRRRGRIVLSLTLILGSLLVPAALWYVHASRLLAAGAHAAGDAVSTWSEALSLRALLAPETWNWVVRFGLVRAFTPMSVALAVVALVRGGSATWWRSWAVGGLITLAVVAGKLHHEYYWLLLAPPVAAGAASSLAALARFARTPRARLAVVALGALLVAACVRTAASTWTTPAEWSCLDRAGPRVAAAVGTGARPVAREAVLWAADRVGFRLESEHDAVRRAFREWTWTVPPERATPAALLAWYHQQGATIWADVGDPALGRLVTPAALAARALARRVLIDEPGLLVIQLPEVPHVVPPGPQP